MELTVAGRPAYAYTGGKRFDTALPAIVFIHGASQDHCCWALQSRYFAHHGHAVLVPDLPGHGRTPGPPLASVEALAEWIGGLIEAAGIASAALVGHSMGSLVAVEAAARLPQRVRALALIGTALPMPVAEMLLDAAKRDEPRARSLVNIWSHGPRAQIGGNTVPGLWMFGANRRQMERAAPGVLHGDLAACNAYLGGAEAAARVRCPALVVRGSRDQMTPPAAARGVADMLGQAQIATIEGAGHALMAEQPDQVLDALRGFLAAR